MHTLHTRTFTFILIIVLKMNVFDDLSSLSEWTEYSDKSEDSDLGPDEVAPPSSTYSSP
jgi:hypothetical protein